MRWETALSDESGRLMRAFLDFLFRPPFVAALSGLAPSPTLVDPRAPGYGQHTPRSPRLNHHELDVIRAGAGVELVPPALAVPLCLRRWAEQSFWEVLAGRSSRQRLRKACSSF